MTTAEADPDTSRSVGRYEWENVLRRIASKDRLTDELQRAALLLATYADPDGTRVRPGEREFAEALRKSRATAGRRVAELQALGFVRLVARGGGHGPGRRSSEFRLTLPADLLEQFDVRPPSATTRGPMTLVTPLSHGERSTRRNSAHSRVSGDAELSPVDNSETALIHGERSSTEPAPELRSNDAVTERNSAQIGANSAHVLDEPHHPPTPPTNPTTTDPDPAQPDTACGQLPGPIDLVAAVELRPAKCPHGAPNHHRPDGTPRCVLCRRNLPAGGEPP